MQASSQGSWGINIGSPVTRSICIAVLTVVASMAMGVPSVLIVQIKPKQAMPADVGVCDALANELQTGARVQPIVWSLTDPIFREAAQSGKIPSGEPFPSLSEAERVADRLGAEYVLVTDMRGGEAQELLGAAFLYQRGRLIWKDPDEQLEPALAHLREMLKKKQITKQQYDDSVLKAGFRTVTVQVGAKYGLSDSVRSLARTWVEMMNSGPFLKLAKSPEKPTPPPAQGEGPIDPKSPTPPPADTSWTVGVAAALKDGDIDKAITLLRDAVDTLPLALDRRLALIKTLMQFGRPDVAAREARRAADLMADQLQLRSLAARAWIMAGNLEEAQSDLNEAVSRAPDSVETRLMLAEVAIDKEDPKAAIGHLDKALAQGPNGDAYYLRALAHAMLGEASAAAEDLKKASESGLSADPIETEERYSLVAAFSDDGLVALGNEVRELHNRAQVKRTDPEVKATFADLAKRIASRTAFISSLPVPALHADSHNRRVLAYKLLSQCLSDLDSYMKSGDVDVLTDSRIDLGEALKQGASARQSFKEEQQGTKKSDASG